jgi:RHH-type proline utilization regulon transcriptional repressor/proline dehydrogenase/delta 1-pyrroline-5-carboxylate dehydrogenase
MGPHKMLASLSASAIAPVQALPAGSRRRQRPACCSAWARKTVVAATVRAIQLLGRQFVLGRTIDEAMGEAAAQRKGCRCASATTCWARARAPSGTPSTWPAYQHAIAAHRRRAAAAPPDGRDGISIKLSALFSRYEDAQRERVFAELLPRVWALVDAAARPTST